MASVGIEGPTLSSDARGQELGDRHPRPCGALVFWCYNAHMARLTISLPAELHQALREAAARRNETIGKLIAESLVAYGVKPEASAVELVRQARLRSALPAGQALSLALGETAAARSRSTDSRRQASRKAR